MYLPGVGPKKAELLQKYLDIYTWEDLIWHFPFRYIDRSKFYKAEEVHGDLPYIQMKGRIIEISETGFKRGKKLIALFSDGTGSIELIWFQGLKWIKAGLKQDEDYVVFGKPTNFKGQINIVHPEIEKASKFAAKMQSALQPVYNTSDKMKEEFLNSKGLQVLIGNIFRETGGKFAETIPEYILRQNSLMGINDAFRNIHFPDTTENLRRARLRLTFEELFFIQLGLLRQKLLRVNKANGLVFSKVGENLNTFYKNHLPFELTEAQKRVIREIRKDVGSGKQMNRLLQGDVGSGKTLVALMTMLIAIDNGYQTCLMVPTEILAQQHFATISTFVKEMGLGVHILTGSTKKAERAKVHEALVSGENKILIGTHALIEDTVVFKNLGMVVIDEQHRFGVAQRASLWSKNDNPPHILVMTATPIPRTLAMTLYGDLDVSVIDELPPGRKPIKTTHLFDSKRLRLFAFMKEQIKSGRQIYVVYPLIEESEKLDYKDLTDGVEGITRAFPAPEYAVSVLHGRMKPEEKRKSMDLFKSGRTQIMISTTVIEVGVDVPNASVMVIESAERFGLSQLHQLRGRVGRGADQSYCILMSSYKLSDDSRKRLETMVGTNDGFEIAEADLKLRGPGDLEGTQQSGFSFDLRIANLAKDGQVLHLARNAAEFVLEKDPLLSNPENRILARQLENKKKSQVIWREIS